MKLTIEIDLERLEAALQEGLGIASPGGDRTSPTEVAITLLELAADDLRNRGVPGVRAPLSVDGRLPGTVCGSYGFRDGAIGDAEADELTERVR